MSKILVVDDDPLIRRFVQGALASEGHTVLQSPDGKSGLETLASEPVDLVVTELAVIAFPGGRATLVETAPGITAENVIASTEAELEVPGKVPQMNL